MEAKREKRQENIMTHLQIWIPFTKQNYMNSQSGDKSVYAKSAAGKK